MILLMVQKSGDHQLRLVVYPIISRFYTSEVVVWYFFHQLSHWKQMELGNHKWSDYSSEAEFGFQGVRVFHVPGHCRLLEDCNTRTYLPFQSMFFFAPRRYWRKVVTAKRISQEWSEWSSSSCYSFWRSMANGYGSIKEYRLWFRFNDRQ